MLGQRKEILMATDGTYKLHFGGWTLVSFGTYGVRYNTTLQYQHKFYPAAFMFVRTETAYAYARLFTVVKDRTKEFFGGILDIQFGSMDHSSEIANAFRQVWPDIKLLNCWPHLDRNARRKNGLLTDSDRYENIIKPQLDYLSLSRSFDQFEALSNLVTSNWSALGETEYAHWLEDQYLVDPWDLWLYTASDEPGIVPNQNPIESHHHAIKTTAVMHLRAATGHVLARTLPRILSQCAMDFGSDIICHYASGLVGSETIQAAMNLCASENHYPKHRGKSKRAILSIGQHYFNAEYYVVRDDNVHGLNVDASRTRLYERSLDGILRAHEKIENVQLRYLSLHRVTILERVPFEHDWDYPSWRVEEIKTIRQKFKCDCKTFYQSGWLYAHVLACLQLVDAVDLNAMLRGLPARRPPGRPRKKAKCLERDGVRRSQYSVSALIKRLVDKPASVINWSVLGTWTSTDDDGAEISRDFVGTVKPPFLRAGKRHWEVEYNEIEKLEEYEAEALATMINYSFRMGHITVPS
ncbi:hypothetical protein PR003_g10697 [Phytophthora rubi]|uniref:Uncharacterized protein n=1 Tax=Phytophthora rubi TaxID=129364 RepID=A0A6A4FEM0_9STRA|nr:hypothetical protein PR003_g10697 [Phytophthora rubi]